ncbi:MAG: hypothetical protein ABEJ98_04645, partial [Candidatus Nanohaloarchaea archaeon]
EEGFAIFFDLHSRDQLQDYDIMNSEKEREEWYQKIDESDMYDESVEERVREIFGIYDNLSQFSEMSDEQALGYIATTVREKMIEAADRPEPDMEIRNNAQKDPVNQYLDASKNTGISSYLDR